MRDWQAWLERFQRVWASLRRAWVFARPYLDPERYSLPQLKWGFSAGAAVWVLLVGLIVLPGPGDNYGVNSSSYREASKRCSGSFSSRYECKSSIIIDGENSAFYGWMWRLVLVFGPPAGLVVYYHVIARRRDREHAEEARKRSALRRSSAIEPGE